MYPSRLLLHAELPDHSVVEVLERRVPHGISGAFRYYASFLPTSEFKVIVDGPRTLDTGPNSDGSVISVDWAGYQYIGGLHGWDSSQRKPNAARLEGSRILLLSEDGVAAALLRRRH
jgi:hypothetical protein